MKYAIVNELGVRNMEVVFGDPEPVVLHVDLTLDEARVIAKQNTDLAIVPVES